jgi:hypothetical protein
MVLTVIADSTALFAGAGLVQAGLAVDALRRFNQRSRVLLRTFWDRLVGA